MRKPFALLVCLLSLPLIGAATALPAQELILGWEGEESRGYGFVMPVFRFGPDGPGSSIVLRPAASYLYYSLPEPGGETDVTSPGAAIGIAYRWSGPRATFTIGPGYEFRSTKRRFASGAETEEDETGINVQGDLFFNITPLTNLNLIASYGDANEYVWVRGGIKRQITNTDFSGPRSLIVGLEATRQGNDEIETNQIGALLEFGFPRARGSLQFRGGLSDTEFAGGASDTGPYFGIGFYKAF
ncbi:MAG TPA: cellulose biosynthesis protein BcsS [Thermoanaerobaculia bacterium]|nr:cellulose biosynthesis protein BcsS [Thermoanaerobaculia bacterium]